MPSVCLWYGYLTNKCDAFLLETIVVLTENLETGENKNEIKIEILLSIQE